MGLGLGIRAQSLRTWSTRLPLAISMICQGINPLASSTKTLAYLCFLSYTNVGCSTQNLEWSKGIGLSTGEKWVSYLSWISFHFRDCAITTFVCHRPGNSHSEVDTVHMDN